MIELSTLTGACMIALGENTAGLFCNDEDMAKQLIETGKKTNE
jgi:leucyl aminopeptidase